MTLQGRGSRQRCESFETSFRFRFSSQARTPIIPTTTTVMTILSIDHDNCPTTDRFRCMPLQVCCGVNASPRSLQTCCRAAGLPQVSARILPRSGSITAGACPDYSEFKPLGNHSSFNASYLMSLTALSELKAPKPKQRGHKLRRPAGASGASTVNKACTLRRSKRRSR